MAAWLITRGYRPLARLLDRRQALAGPQRAPGLAAGPALDLHHVGGEVVLPTDQGRAHAVGVDRDPGGFEGADALHVEASRDHDPHVGEPRVVETAAHLLYQPAVDAGGPEAAHLVQQRAVDQRLRRV